MEDIALFLKEIEGIMETLEFNSDPNVELDCRLRIVQLQHYIETITNSFTIPYALPSKKLMS